LGFGVIFATVVTLILIPALYVILEDWLSLFAPADEVSESVTGNSPL
jgi:Na+-driven multidrug efflux pump